jgi:hypothetical protein
MKEYTMENTKISMHAKERYAQRLMDKDNKSDMAIFIAQHEQKIKEDIIKMIKYGTLLYTGKSTCEFNKQTVDIFLNGTWVIIVDVAKANVVTLYSIDLGLGNEFNNEYIKRLLDKLNAAKEEFDMVMTGIMTQKETYSSIINENTEQINEFKQMIKNLEKQNQAYFDVIDSLEADKVVAEKNIRDIIAIMTGKKIF